jgi:hypothetical protein
VNFPENSPFQPVFYDLKQPGKLLVAFSKNKNRLNVEIQAVL